MQYIGRELGTTKICRDSNGKIWRAVPRNFSLSVSGWTVLTANGSNTFNIADLDAIGVGRKGWLAVDGSDNPAALFAYEGVTDWVFYFRADIGGGAVDEFLCLFPVDGFVSGVTGTVTDVTFTPVDPPKIGTLTW